MKKLHILIPTLLATSIAPLSCLVSLSSCGKEHDYSKDYFTIEGVTDGKLSCDIDDSVGEVTISLDLWYSINDGQWTKLEPNFKSKGYEYYVAYDENDIIRLKGNNETWSCDDVNVEGSWYTTLSFDGIVNLSGNIMSLLYGDDFYGQTTLPCGGCFEKALWVYGVFDDQDEENSLIFKAENLILPATNITPDCYNSMFEGQKIMLTAPKVLPATTLKDSCYHYMFCDCHILKIAPKLPALTLAISCYEYMFCDCYKLTTAPELPALTLANNCYAYMFYDCHKLTTAPELPALTLANSCYIRMFSDCYSLLAAPKLLAPALAEWCYTSMFHDCSSLKVEDHGDDDKIIFACPNEIPDYAVQNMFLNTGGTIKSDPEPGKTYYWCE